MSINTSTHTVCRLLGGSGRASLTPVPIRKLPALLEPLRRQPTEVFAIQSSALPLAA